jgi:hypothetical protein
MILTASRLLQVAFMQVRCRQPQASDMGTCLHCHGAKSNHHGCKEKWSQGLQDASPKRKPQPIHAYQIILERTLQYIKKTQALTNKCENNSLHQKNPSSSHQLLVGQPLPTLVGLVTGSWPKCRMAANVVR